MRIKFRASSSMLTLLAADGSLSRTRGLNNRWLPVAPDLGLIAVLVVKFGQKLVLLSVTGGVFKKPATLYCPRRHHGGHQSRHHDRYRGI